VLLGNARVRRTVQLLGVLWVLSLSDLYFTVWAYRCTPFHEVNPLARLILDAGSVGGVVLLKVGLTGLASAIFWYLRRHGRSEVALWLMVLTHVGLMFCWADYTRATLGMLP
jgi:hypothetical protein